MRYYSEMDHIQLQPFWQDDYNESLLTSSIYIRIHYDRSLPVIIRRQCLPGQLRVF